MKAGRLEGAPLSPWQILSLLLSLGWREVCDLFT